MKALNLELVENIESDRVNQPYKIGVGDALVITVWGLPETFPMNNVNQDTNSRIVNTDGTIFSICGNTYGQRKHRLK